MIEGEVAAPVETHKCSNKYKVNMFYGRFKVRRSNSEAWYSLKSII